MKTSPKLLNKITFTLLTILIFFALFPLQTFASNEDFSIQTDTEIKYVTGNTYVTVTNKYTRKVLNSSYYYPASGEKVFHLPDPPDATEGEIKTEREYKKKDLTVKNLSGNAVSYSIEDLDDGEGIYIKIPNYKQTTSKAQYDIVVTYKTHDFIRKVNNWVNIQAPALSSDTDFTYQDDRNNTITKYIYNLDIVTDQNIPELVKIYPAKYELETRNKLNHYTFSQEDRLDNSVYLEFGTHSTYKFELTYTTPKTDSFVPEQYSNIFKALSTNIFELSLPREFSETNQSVLFENISPTPKSIARDSEGNIIATFEVPANKVSEISISGYVWVTQDSLEEQKPFPEMSISDYRKSILESGYALQYLSPTKYWEVNDTYIQEEAQKLSNDQTTLYGLIKADYAYVNDKLEYDTSKATSENERIGAKAALQGGASVCMEYADSMIALLRTQGIPARAALGYSNLEEESLAPDVQVRHQWVQIWIPDYGWYSIDPTFESNNMKMGQEIDRILWETFSGENLSNIRIFSADNLDALDSDGYKVKIFGVTDDQIPSKNDLLSYIQLVPNSKYEDIEDIPELENYNVLLWVNSFLKTTTVGKSLIITGPIIIILTILVLLTILARYLIRKLKAKKNIPKK